MITELVKARDILRKEKGRCDVRIEKARSEQLPNGVMSQEFRRTILELDGEYSNLGQALKYIEFAIENEEELLDEY